MVPRPPALLHEGPDVADLVADGRGLAVAEGHALPLAVELPAGIQDDHRTSVGRVEVRVLRFVAHRLTSLGRKGLDGAPCRGGKGLRRLPVPVRLRTVMFVVVPVVVRRLLLLPVPLPVLLLDRLDDLVVAVPPERPELARREVPLPEIEGLFDPVVDAQAAPISASPRMIVLQTVMSNLMAASTGGNAAAGPAMGCPAHEKDDPRAVSAASSMIPWKASSVRRRRAAAMKRRSNVSFPSFFLRLCSTWIRWMSRM